MNTKNSNERPIENLKGDAVNGDGIVGGGKVVPIIIEQEGMGIPVDVTSSVVITPMNDAADYSLDSTVQMTDGSVTLQ